MKKFIISESEKREILGLYNVSNNTLSEATSRPTTYNDILKFQNWVLNTIKDKNILGTYGADGKWGKKSQAAWNLYGGRYGSGSVGFGSPSKRNSSQGYPYDKLNNNPTPKFIAWVIKNSDGGYIGNDTEAHAEAAFNAIKTPKMYTEVTKYLAKDPYDFISGFMDTKTRYHLNSVEDHYTELFKNSPDNKPKVKKPNNVKDFQNWVLNVKKDKLILGRYGADGDWGTSTINAWNKYGNEYLKSDRNDNLEDESESYDGFAIPFAFPDYEPTVDGHNIWDKFIGVVSSALNGAEHENTYGKIGHAGISLVTNSGNVITYEFGRYTDKEYGVKLSKPLGKIAKIEDGKITNIDSVINIIHKNSHGQGPKLLMESVVLKTPDVNGGIKYANSITSKDYSAFDFSISDSDANCATFAIEVIRASGIDIPTTCLNTPHKMIQQMQYVKDIQDKEYLSAFGKAVSTGAKILNPMSTVSDYSVDLIKNQ